ncbi:hypothetical protein QOZ80_7BG0584450 [Eleusine coracana subsp. coracana]|nr:hypothetical protein QOZ80_7BG0584450 [Eleusine coracana subsp. coracana]
MEFLLSALLSELSTRSINFFIKKFSKPTELDVAGNLQRALLQAQVITDEAIGRPITNHAMLMQLNLLREAIYRGCYKLDTFRYQSYNEDIEKQVWSYFSSLSKVNSAMRFFFSIRDGQNLDELHEVLDNLRSMILDANQLILLLTSYPCLYRHPYSMHLLLGNCMFGRQMEAELVINCLLSTKPHGSDELEILPIVGPSKVGKSTLVAHISKDERVRDHFSEVVFLQEQDFTDNELTTIRGGPARKQQNRLPKLNKEGGSSLVVVELDGNLNKDAWNKLYSACIPRGSKIVVTSRSDKIVKLGTTQALILKHLSHEAYWYFLKTLIFGSTDPEMHPRLAHLAMEIARSLDGSLFRANIAANLLRDNFDIRFWCKVLAFTRMYFQKHLFNVVDQNRPAHFRRTDAPSKDLVVYHQYHQRSSEEEVPNVGIQDVIFGSFKPHGKFEVLVFRSRIPPYHSFVYISEIGELTTVGVKRKRLMKNRTTLY